jgi:hypothetical protein
MGNPPNQNISISAGGNSNVAGIVYGDVNYYSFYSSPLGGSSRVDLDSYRASVSKKLGEIRSRYTLLNIDPVLSTIGRDLKPVEGSERTLIEAVANSQRFVIFGGAGAGKTTSLRFLACAITSDANSFPTGGNRRPDTCLLIDLTRFRLNQYLGPLKSILVLIGELLHAATEAEPPSFAAIHDLFSSQNRLLLLFDGLNEVPIEGRSSCLKGIIELAERYPSHSYVLATRPYGFRPVDGWEMGALRDLREPQIQEFLTRYTDPETGHALTIRLRGNPLAGIPLFLSYILEICRSGTAGTSSLSSRSAVIGSYIEILLNRDRPELQRLAYSQETDVLKSALISLAEKSNSVGQSIDFKDAVEILVKREGVDLQTATNILEDLFARTLLVHDGQYVRFWHQTIQEHFHAANIVGLWRDNRRGLFGSGRSIKRVFVAAGEQSALLHVPYFLSNDELRVAFRRCVNWNIGLAIWWLEDMYYEVDRSQLTSEATRDLRRRALVASRYSRLGRRKWQLVALVGLFWCLCYPVAPLPVAVMTLLFEISHQRAVFISAYASIFLLWLYLIIHLLRSPGPEVLDQLFTAAFQIHNHDLRVALVSIASEVERSNLTAISQKALATSVAKTGVEDDAFMILRNSPSLIAGINVLGRVADESAVSILEFCLSCCKNVNSRQAMESLVQRASLFPREKDNIRGIAVKVLGDPDSEWGLIQTAKRCLRWAWFRRPTVIGFKHRIQSAAIAFLCVLALSLVFEILLGLIQGADRQIQYAIDPNLERSDLKLRIMVDTLIHAACGGFLYFSVRKVSKGAENVSPLKWALSALFFYISIPLFYFYRDEMVRNAIPFDWDGLRNHLKAHSILQ